MVSIWSQKYLKRMGILAIAAMVLIANMVAIFPYVALAADIQAGEVWNRRPVDNYAQVHSVKTSSDGQTIFSATRQGVYRSEDGGTTWLDITGPIREGSYPTWIEGNTSHIDVSASGDDVIATYREYVYISHDSGDNWTEVSDWGGGSDQSSIIYVAMSSDGQTMALISNDSKLYLSQDGGATFGIVADFVPSSLRDVVVSSDGQYIAVVSDNSVYVSSDNGTTWDQTYENGDSYAPTSLRMSDDGSTMAFSDYEQGVRISTDYGQTWGVYDNGLASFESAEVFVAPQSGDVYMIINNNEIYRTQNSGTTWQPYDDGISDDCYGITDMSYDEDTVVATCVDGTVLKVSQNGGATWQNSTLTKEDVRHYWTSIDSSSDNQIQLAGSGGIDTGSTGRSGDDNLFVSYDSGVTWTAAESAGRSNWVDVAVSSDGEHMLAVARPPGVTEEAVYSCVWASEDSGVTWNEAYCVESYIEAVAMSDDGQYASFAAWRDSDRGIYVSSDYAQSWSRQPGTQTDGWIDIASSGDGSQLLAITESPRRVKLSTDYGQTWSTPSALSTYDAIKVASSSDGQNLFAVSSGDDIASSTTAGLSWSMTDLSGSLTSVDVSSDGQKVVVLGYNNVHTSTNAGQDWNEYAFNDSNDEDPGAERRWVDVTTSDDGLKLTGVAVGLDGEVWSGGYIFTSEFEASPPPVPLTPIIPEPLAGVCEDNSQGAALTINWSPATEPFEGFADSYGDVVASADGMTLVQAVDGSYIYMSTDGGISWHPITDLGEEYWAGPAEISPNGQVILVPITSTTSHLSTDGGQNWSEITHDPYVHILNDYGLISKGSGTDLKVSYDYGQTWADVPLPDETDEYINWTWDDFKISDDAQVMAGVIQKQNPDDYHWEMVFVVSQDGGATWTYDYNIISDDSYDTFKMSQDGSTMLLKPDYSTQFLVSHDYGQSWTSSTSIDEFEYLFPNLSANGDMIFASTYKYDEETDTVLSQLFVSTDDGQTWQEQSGLANWEGTGLSPTGSTLFATDIDTYGLLRIGHVVSCSAMPQGLDDVDGLSGSGNTTATSVGAPNTGLVRLAVSMTFMVVAAIVFCVAIITWYGAGRRIDARLADE